MKDLEQLWKFRLHHFLQQMMKYGRLMLNDHFSVVLMAMIGFGGIFYKELLSYVQANVSEFQSKVILLGISVVLSVVVQLNRPIFLMKIADSSYLLAKGQQWHAYWKKGIVLGYVVSLIPIGMMLGLMMPLIVVLSSLSLVDGWWLFLLLALWKWLAIWCEYMSFYESGNTDFKPYTQFACRMAIVGCLTGVLLENWGVTVGLTIGYLIYTLQTWQRVKKQPVHFEALVEADQQREATLYKWIAIFADVPKAKSKIYHSKVSDKVLHLLKTDNYKTYLYLRTLVRHFAYRGIWVRLLFFTACLLSINTSFYVALGLGIVSAFATAMQIVPVMQKYDTHDFYRLYPNWGQSHAQALRIPLSCVLYTQTIVYIVIVVIRFGLSGYSSVIAGVWLLSSYAIAYYYPLFWSKKKGGKRK